jgi:hypothetical protein
MRKYIKSFLPWLAICILCERAYPTTLHQTQKQPTQPQSTNTAVKIEFTNVAAGESEDENGNHFGLVLFEGTDGSKVTVRYNTFESESKARQYFNDQIARASKVLQKGNKLDASGKIVGQRAEIVVLRGHESVPAVLWVVGASFHEFISSSRSSILTVEKDYK